MESFADRREAGARLGIELAGRLAAVPIIAWAAGLPPVVLGLPRGGVPVAAEVAAALQAPLDVLLVRKVGTPGQPELAMGAVGEGGVIVVNHWVADRLGTDSPGWQRTVRAEQDTVDRRATQIRAVRPAVRLADRLAIVVDDGIATGATARAACAVARARGAAGVVLAVPVIAPEAARELVDGEQPAADLLVWLMCPAGFGGVGQYYRDFSPTPDREVMAILQAAGAGR